MRMTFRIITCWVLLLPATLCGQSTTPSQAPLHDNSGKQSIINELGMKLIAIPPGEFVMGATDSDNTARSHEKPPHRVQITRSLYMSAYEVTVAQFRAFVDSIDYQMDGDGNTSGYNSTIRGFEYDSPNYSWRNTGYPQDDEHPVVNVNWYDAQAFCRWLSKKEERRYRLPTEAEWEYACRAGTTTRFTIGEDVSELRLIANTRDQSLKEQWDTSTVRKYGLDPKAFPFLQWNDGHAFTAPVGRFKPNAFGLYDMLGNVGEFCSDSYSAEYYTDSPQTDPTGPSEKTDGHIVRGGTFLNDAKLIRVSSRVKCPDKYRNYVIGFRVVMENDRS